MSNGLLLYLWCIIWIVLLYGYPQRSSIFCYFFFKCVMVWRYVFDASQIVLLYGYPQRSSIFSYFFFKWVMVCCFIFDASWIVLLYNILITKVNNLFESEEILTGFWAIKVCPPFPLSLLNRWKHCVWISQKIKQLPQQCHISSWNAFIIKCVWPSVWISQKIKQVALLSGCI